MVFSPRIAFCLSGEADKIPSFLLKEIERISREVDFE